jgi:hypothetical protein
MPDPFPEYQKRVASMIAAEIESLAHIIGVHRMGFMTLTFADHVVERDEASDRYRSLRSNVFAKRYELGMSQWERQRSGRLHVHLVLAMPEDIQTGVDFAAIARGDYRSAPKKLLDEWRFLRETVPSYGFGRTELLPVKSTAQALGRYVGGYLSKSYAHRSEQDEGRRLVGFFGYGRAKHLHRRAGLHFAWNSAKARIYRMEIATFAAVFGILDHAEMAKVFGPKWAYFLREWIAERLYMEMDPEGCARVEAAKQCGKDAESVLFVPLTRESFRLRMSRLAKGLPSYQERKLIRETMDQAEVEIRARQVRERWSHLTQEDMLDSILDYERKAQWTS